MRVNTWYKGFTLIELILVIVILSIIALTASSRFIGVDSFASRALQDQVVSVIRLVQVNRMQSNTDITANNNFELRVEPGCIGSGAACDSMLESRSDWVDANYYTEKSVTFSVSGAAATTTIEFDLFGNPIDAFSNGATIIISEATQQTECLIRINEQGYVERGDCS